MTNHPSHLLRRELRGCDDKVALVLPVHVVHDDHELARCDGGDSFLDGIEKGVRMRRVELCWCRGRHAEEDGKGAKVLRRAERRKRRKQLQIAERAVAEQTEGADLFRMPRSQVLRR